MNPRTWNIGLIAILLAAVISGCQDDDTSETAQVLPEWLDDKGVREADTVEAPPIETARLELNLNQGDRFPIHKVIQQELTQYGLGDRPEVSTTRLELMLAISVQRSEASRLLMNVRYDSIKYSEEIRGHRVDYDSNSPPAQPTPLMLAYQRMIGDGFSFWLGADNQIHEPVGFDEFLDRCLVDIPDEQRGSISLGIRAGSGENGITDFVDNTIGLLPFGREPAIGESWNRSQRITFPVPMTLDTTYTLTQLSEQMAVVSVDGRIVPSTTLTQVSATDQMRILIRGGQMTGRCSIYRDTGLPQTSEVSQTIDMTVAMNNGTEFEQTKRVTTLVESYPVQSHSQLHSTSTPTPVIEPQGPALR